ncbi:hypothetical protein [Reyranella sp.]|uniref:hypothetical protein n=1 Tax=Reyranella sp. TaxID=1929291 RepID=UPI0012102E4D|nr:hypothetical protein [Reyranella sp.]TAJ89701.1 MAG: hypothetical protein EPO50_04880 [Reyranella sp.]
MAMSIAVRETIKTVGVDRLHRFSGIPIRTLYNWSKADKLPGKGATLEWRLSQFKVAAAQAAAEKAREELTERMAPARKRRAA